MQMEMQQLRYALAVADAGTFTAAAALVRVSQSAVSTQVQALERELGVAIFDRRPTGARPTEAGEVLIGRIRTALAAVDDIGATAAAVVGLLRGTVRVGAVASLAWPPFFDAIESVRSAHPGLDVSLREGRSAQIQADVLDGLVDVAVVSWVETPPPGLDAWVAVEERVAAHVAPDHPWATRDAVSPDELIESDLIALTPGTGMRAAFDHLMRSEGLHPRVRWEVTLPSTARGLAHRGMGVAVLTTSRADPPDELVRVPIRSRYATSRLGVVWRSRPAPSAPTEAMLRALREHLGAPETPGQVPGRTTPRS